MQTLTSEHISPRIESPKNDQFDQTEAAGLLGFLTVLLVRKGLILCLTAIGGILAAYIAFSIPNQYTATAVIMPPQQGQSAATALLGSLGPMASVASKELGLKNSADLYLGLLGSRTIADHLIGRFHLQEVYKVKTISATRAILQRHRQFSAGKDSLIHVDVEDDNPQRAADLANAFLEELNLEDRELATSDSGQRRLFLEGQLNQEKVALAAAEEAMKTSQSQSGVLQIDAQSRMTLTSIAELKAKISSGEVMLQHLRMSETSENPQVMNAESDLNTMRGQLQKMEGATRTTAGDPLVTTSEIPQAALIYMRKLRDMKYHEFLFEMLSKQYEVARIDEAKAAPPLQIVDKGIAPERKSGPPRLLMILIGLCIAAVFGVILAYVLNWFQIPKNVEKLRRLKAAAAGYPTSMQAC
jgi:tyrosine-protein kinase Etk/Wzc